MATFRASILCRGEKMDLKKLLSEEINLNLIDNPHVDEEKFKVLIHDYPREIFCILVGLQEKEYTQKTLYLPSGLGSLSFHLDPKNDHQIDVYYDKSPEKDFQSKFKSPHCALVNTHVV